MSKKLLISVSALLATAAFVVMPAAAVAETPHYTCNGPNISPTSPCGEVVTTTAWGTITLKGTKGGVPGSFITCHNVAAGTAVNPGGGAPATDKIPGKGLTQTFATFDCESEGICPAGTTPGVLAEELPWGNELEISGGIVRQSTGGKGFPEEGLPVKVFITCSVGKKVEGGAKFVTNAASVCCKTQKPNSKHGTSALHPGFLEFGIPSSGELEVEKSAETVTGGTEGEVKVLGYNEQELINTKKDPA